jgi:hypothetical protein
MNFTVASIAVKTEEKANKTSMKAGQNSGKAKGNQAKERLEDIVANRTTSTLIVMDIRIRRKS